MVVVVIQEIMLVFKRYENLGLGYDLFDVYYEKSSSKNMADKLVELSKENNFQSSYWSVLQTKCRLLRWFFINSYSTLYKRTRYRT